MDFEKIGERIRDRRKELELSADKVAQDLKVDRSTIFRYEKGDIGNMSAKKVKKLADILKVSPAYLLGLKDEEELYTTPPVNEINIDTLDNISPLTPTTLPLLGKIACGNPTTAIQDNEQTTAYLNPHADFALKTKGDSMINAHIKDGDIAFIRKQPTVENGEIAAVLIGDEATLKRVYHYPLEQKLVLQAENPAYPPLVFTDSELQDVMIIGKVVGVQTIF